MTNKLLLATALLFASQISFANPDGEQSSDRRGPPPEAFTACEGKSAGDAAEFEDPRRGETITGTCEEMRGELVLKPDNHDRNH